MTSPKPRKTSKKRAPGKPRAPAALTGLAASIDGLWAQDFSRALRAWFQAQARDLPWRRLRTGYRVWVSEVMLQQTRVATVVPFYERFLRRFPDLASLAQAPLDDVLALWSGLGYYRRARSLHEGARYVVEHLGGDVPSTADALRAVPGIGPYTAGAIASLAFGEAAPLVDGNVVRVYARVFALEGDVARTATQRAVWSVAHQMVDPTEPGAYNEALMELGATVCSPKNPRCLLCPVRPFCQAHRTGRQDELPRKTQAKVVPTVYVASLIARRRGKVLLGRRQRDSLFGGLWEPPMFESTDALVAEAAVQRLAPNAKKLGSVTHTLSHRKMEVTILHGTPHAGATYPQVYEEFREISEGDLPRYGISSLAKRVLAAVPTKKVLGFFMDILHVASELAPYAKVGGLADVVSALTKHLRLLGHKVTVALPRYRALHQAGPALARRLTPLTFQVDGKAWDAHVYDGKTASGVEVVLIDIPGLEERAGIYGEHGETYPDNSARFALFCHAVLALIQQRAQQQHPFSLVHVHDWPTSLLPFLMHRHMSPRPATVLTIHNAAHQGVTPRDQQAVLGLQDEDFTLEGVEFFGHINLLKAGIVSADAITTVSETYARDILTAEHGARLDGVLLARQNDLTGILNGVDGSIWNPATDGALAARYDVEDITNKTRCKGALLAELQLDVAVDRPLFAFVGRLVHQKGADLILAALPKMLAADVSLVVAGDGDDALVKKLQAACTKHPKQIAFVPAAEERLVHRLYAGADFLLVPSRFEPCGLVQLYAQRYGTLPVAHATGGLNDTIVDCDASLETGTGFLFEAATAASLVGVVQRARSAFQQPGWAALVRRVMRLDRGWERPARRYEQIYRKVCSIA